MTTFDYAQSNSLLRNESTPPSKESSSDGIKTATADASAPKATPTSKLKEKIKPVKKTKSTKHNLTNGATSIATPKPAAPIAASPEPESTTDAQSAPNPSKARASDTPKDGEKAMKKPRVRKPRRIIPNKKEYIPANEQPTQSDVVGGRGGRSNHHPGNRPYWIRILESRIEYTKSRSDHEKARIANGILKYVQEELLGRFLNIDSKTKQWYILPNNVVLDKIKQALRDKYIPYWARDLKIENKKHEPVVDSVMGMSEDATENKIPRILNVENKRPHTNITPPNPMLALGQSYAGMRNPHLVNPAITLAAMNASRANAVASAKAANALSLAGAAAATAATTAGARANPLTSKKKDNKLDFLLGSSARRPLAHNPAVIPTIDDILKCKVDQMPSFGGVSNAELMAAAMANATAPPIHSIGVNPYQTSLPPSVMASLGLGLLPNTISPYSEAAHRGFGAAGNPGAPALPSATFGLPSIGMPSIGMPSLGVLQDLNMKSLDKYLEEKMVASNLASLGAPSFATNMASLSSLGRINALAGSSFDSAYSNASASSLAAALAPKVAAAAAAPTGPKKTDWNAMFTSALTNSKTR